MFLCSLIYCVNSVLVLAVYAKYVSTPIHPVEFPQKNQFPNKPGFPLSTLIILDWYPYVSLFHDLLCKFGLSVSGLRKIRFNAYTPRRISTKNQFPKKPGFPLSALIILDRSNVDLLLFKKESGKNRIMVNRVCLAVPKRATITCRDRKKLRS